MTVSALQRDLVIVACAVSAGIHAARTPDHFREGAGAGGGFLTATIVLGVLAVLLTWRPDHNAALVGAALVLAGLIGSYALAVTGGMPLLHPDVEPIDSLALVTRAIEAAGLVASLQLLRRDSTVATLESLRLKGTLT